MLTEVLVYICINIGNRKEVSVYVNFAYVEGS
jgi:hypothetical protein